MQIINEELKQTYNTVLAILSNTEYNAVPDQIIFDTLTDYIIENKNLIKNLPDETDPELPEFNKKYFEKQLQTKTNTTLQDITALAKCIMICKHFNKELENCDVPSMRNIKVKIDLWLDYIDIITKTDEYWEGDDTSYRLPLKPEAEGETYYHNGLLKEEKLIDAIWDIIDTIKLGATLTT